MATRSTAVSLKSEAPQCTTIFATLVGAPEEPYGDSCDQSQREMHGIHQSSSREQWDIS